MNTLEKIVCVVVAYILLAIIAGHASGYDLLPDRKAYFSSPTIAAEIHSRMAACRLLRAEYPDAEFRVQVWQDYKTGAFNFETVAIQTQRVPGRTNFYVTVLRTWETPFEYRKRTGRECDYSLSLDDYEWFHSGGDA
jgi:hypothetical protein